MQTACAVDACEPPLSRLAERRLRRESSTARRGGPAGRIEAPGVEPVPEPCRIRVREIQRSLSIAPMSDVIRESHKPTSPLPSGVSCYDKHGHQGLTNEIGARRIRPYLTPIMYSRFPNPPLLLRRATRRIQQGTASAIPDRRFDQARGNREGSTSALALPSPKCLLCSRRDRNPAL